MMPSVRLTTVVLSAMFWVLLLATAVAQTNTLKEDISNAVKKPNETKDIGSYNPMTSLSTELVPSADAVLDTKVPTVVIDQPASGSYLPAGTITLKGRSYDNSGGSGIKKVELVVGSGTYKVATPKSAGDWSSWSIPVSLSSPGSYRMVSRATDNAGNQAWYSVTIAYDTTSTTGSKDRFGITRLNPTSTNGRLWDSNWDNGIWRTFSNLKNDPSDPEFETYGFGSATYKTAGDGVLKISGKTPRLYVYDTTGAKSWKNVEITVYAKRVSDTKIDWGGIQAITRTNHGAYGGSDDSHPCDTRGYGGQIRYDGQAAFEKEIKHGTSYAKAGVKTLWSNGMPYNQWIGYKFVVRDINSGQDVKLELYMDTTNGLNGGSWQKKSEFIDTGTNFGKGLTPCKSGIDPALPLTSSNSRPGSESGKPNIAVYFRSDGVGTDGLWYKNASIREINPLP